jgi:hypothetical protein
LGFIKNIEKERKKEREKKIEIVTHCCCFCCSSSSSSVSTILFPVLQKQLCVDSADEQTEIFEFQSVCS